MHRLMAVVAGLACLATACTPTNNDGFGDAGDDSGDAGDEPCVAYEPDADLTTPVVSFQNDVIPIIQFSCGIAGSTCHGTPDVTAQQRPYLGNFDGGTDNTAVIAGIVGVPSWEEPQMPMVTASDPGNSFLMHKVDWDQCVLAPYCAQGLTQYTDCGQGMPYSSDQLDTPTRDTIRRWIAQGAQNN